jgi:hypothetical protein
LRKKAQGAAQRDKPGADLPDGAAIVLAEVGYCLPPSSRARILSRESNLAARFYTARSKSGR